MANNWDYEQANPPLDDTKVDRLLEAPSGVIDELSPLTIDIPDHQIIQNLNQRIDDSIAYWDRPQGHNLRTSRSDNARLYLGKQLDVRSLYRFQIPYIENQIYVAEQSITAYLTAERPQPEVAPAQDTPMSKKFASDFEKILMSHSQKVNLQQILETAVKHALNDRIGLIDFEFDPNHGKNGEIIPRAVNPAHVVIDKNAALGQNPAFICIALKMSANQILERWPEKKNDLFRALKIVRGTVKQMEQIVDIRKVWLTRYNDQYMPEETLVYYFGDIVLEKSRNPNWLHSSRRRNFLDAPRKPYIALNFDNSGDHWIDDTSAIEQASHLQMILNKRGRQFMEVVDKANGVIVIDTNSGISKDDAQNMTGDPNQKLVISTPPGKRGQDMVFQIPPPQVPNILMQDKVDIRTQIHSVMGSPNDTIDTGGDGDEALGQTLIKNKQRSGRLDLYIRAIDRFMNDYFNMLTQMMVVWYDEKHYFVYNGGDGEFDYLTVSRELIEEGIAVNVKSGTTLPFDKQRQEAIALKFLDKEAISLLDAYKLTHMANPQQLYDNWAKQKADPQALARDALAEVDESNAYVAYIEIMNGHTPKDPQHVNKEYVLTLRKLMIDHFDDFAKAPKKYQKAFLDYVNKAVTQLELKTALDMMSQQGVQNLSPSVPINPQLAMQPPMPAQQGQPAMGGMGQPPQGPPMGGAPMQPQSPFSGTPLQNPATATSPNMGNPSAIPMV